MKLAQVIALYVAFRKNLGVSFENDAKLLQMFSRAVGETLDISSVQADRVKAFLDGRGPITRYWHRKLTVLRGFYRYAISRGYVGIVPLPTMVPKQPERFVPHIYSRQELQRLLDGTTNYQKQRIQMEPHTFRTILLALYGAALREGECLSLTLSDVDLHQSLLTIRDTKFYKSRLVPLGCDLNKAMLRYAGQRKTAGHSPVARQTVLGPATAAPVADLSATRTVGTQAIGDVGALIWVAEQLDLIGHIDRACGNLGSKGGPSAGELAVAVAIQRACSPGPKRDLAEFLGGAVPRLSCLPSSAFTGQAYHRVAQHVTDEQLEQAQIAIAQAAVSQFQLSADVLAFDTTNFDTHIATVTPGGLARRGHAKSKRSDLRVVGLGVLASETGHVPLLYRTYAGNSSDQAVLTACLEGLKALHQSLDAGEGRERAQRTLVRDGGFWSPQLELDLETIGYYNLISLPLGHAAAEQALQMAAKRGAMKPLTGKLAQVRAARVEAKVGNLDRTLVVVESQELLEGQKRGIAVALRKAKDELRKLERLVKAKRISCNSLEQRIKKTLGREHLWRFVVTEIGGDGDQPTLRWHVDAALRRQMEKTRLGKRVLCTDHHLWTTGRIVQAFRGQWNVEELFRRAKKGGVAPWGPSHQWADGSIRLHLCNGPRTDACEPGEDHTRNRRLRPGDDG